MIRIEALRMRPLDIPFRTTFAHASAVRAKTASVWVEACSADGETGYGEGCPREYVTAESVQTAQRWFDLHKGSIAREITNLSSLANWVVNKKQEIDQAPAAWCGVEMALLDLIGKTRGETLEALLSLPPLSGPFRYSAVLGDAAPAVFQGQMERYAEAGFTDFKVKLSGALEQDRAKVGVMTKLPGARIRADANNLWRSADEAAVYLERLGQPFWAIEEPLVARDFEGMATLAAALGVPIILDESFTRPEALASAKDAPSRYVLNLRVSKLGGLLRSLDMLQQARALGMRVVVGAHVGETSVLARAGITLMHAAGDSLLASEGAFGTHLLTRDVVQEPIMFGHRGMLAPADFAFPARAGMGIAITGVD